MLHVLWSLLRYAFGQEDSKDLDNSGGLLNNSPGDGKKIYNVNLEEKTDEISAEIRHRTT